MYIRLHACLAIPHPRKKFFRCSTLLHRRLIGSQQRFYSKLPPYDPIPIEQKWRQSPDFGLTDTNSHSTSPADFTMLFPPPNITGHLHCGHALTASIQDALCRYHALHGKRVRWIPGTDHAGIATQSVVEKHLWKTLGKTRREIGQEAFLEYTWKWVKDHQKHIYYQLSQLGLRMNWEDAFFTLDAPRSKIVNDAFRLLDERGLIYRADKLVHWCCSLQTGISDIEVDYVSVPGPTTYKTPHGPMDVGELHHVAYTLASDPEQTLTVATTRIETVLGDTALAVHPADARYARFVGHLAVHPLTRRLLPVVADARVDPAFGTGAVKVSPGHDFRDAELAHTHALPALHVLDADGRIAPACGVPTLVGLRRGDARTRVRALLAACGAYRGATPHAARLPVCSRTGDLLEPRAVPQWYLRCRGMAGKVLGQMQRGELAFTQPWARDEMAHWLEHITDWCISRQNGWGHRVPAFFSTSRNQWTTVRADTAAAEDDDWVQDTDVLDTWFSSALLPISATHPQLDLRTPSAALARPPTDVLETGSDILFFWVARMAMLSAELTGQPPCRTVVLHGMVRDAQGRKMSKSLGNVLDPLAVCTGQSLAHMQASLRASHLPRAEIERGCAELAAKFPAGFPVLGADALRLTLLASASARQLNLDPEKFQLHRRILNKLWNLGNFALMHAVHEAPDLATTHSLSVPDAWILHRFQTTLTQWQRGFASFMDVGHATQVAMQFLLDDVSGHYLEFMKRRVPTDPHTRSVVKFTLRACLAFLHPMVPHITQELHARVFGDPHVRPVPALLPTSDPGEAAHAETAAAAFDVLLLLIQRARALTGVRDRLDVYTDEHHALVTTYAPELARLTRFKAVLAHARSGPDDAVVVVTPAVRLGVPENAAVQAPVNPAKWKARMAKCIHEIEQRMASVEYRTHAPVALQQRDAEKLNAFRERIKLLE